MRYRQNQGRQLVPVLLFFSCYLQEPRRACLKPVRRLSAAAVILPAALLRCAAVPVPGRLRPLRPPAARSAPFPARLGGAVAIWSRRPNANTLARIRGILREMPACVRPPQCESFGLLGHAPELKSLRIDGFFDGSAGEFVGRSFLGADGAGGGPRAMLRWKFAAGEIAGEGLQTFPRFRLENVNPHDSILVTVRAATGLAWGEPDDAGRRAHSPECAGCLLYARTTAATPKQTAAVNARPNRTVHTARSAGHRRERDRSLGHRRPYCCAL